MSVDPAERHSAEVRRYYDHNSSKFERLGQGGASIHRAVWGPGVSTRAAAFHHVDELILSELSQLAGNGGRPRVLDLGCGLGASLLYLAQRRDISGEGITISPRQAQRASELVAGTRLVGQVRCRQGNYLALPADLAGADLAFSIEALVHSPDGAGFFQEAARVLRPGGKLVVCDDLLSSRKQLPSAREQQWIDEFCHGWRIGTLITGERAGELAGLAGLDLVADQDLSPYLELRRPRDRLVSLLLAPIRKRKPQGEYWRSLLGGDALQRALQAGVLQYRFLTFKKRG